MKNSAAHQLLWLALIGCASMGTSQAAPASASCSDANARPFAVHNADSVQKAHELANDGDRVCLCTTKPQNASSTQQHQQQTAIATVPFSQVSAPAMCTATNNASMSFAVRVLHGAHATPAAVRSARLAASGGDRTCFCVNKGFSWASCPGDEHDPALLDAAQPMGFPHTLAGANGASAADVPLPPSAAGLLLVLRRIARDCSSTVAVARSYDGHRWEGVQPAALEPNCSATATAPTGAAAAVGAGQAGNIRCTVDLASAAAACGGCSFRVDAVNASAFQLDVNQSAARLLNQATFGATRSSVAALAQQHELRAHARRRLDGASFIGAATAWVAQQMALPATYLREHYRQRTNPRTVTDSQAGEVIKACEVGSRWHRFAFNSRDLFELLVVSHEKPGVWSLRVGGALRTELTEWNGVAAPKVVANTTASTWRFCVINEQLYDPTVRPSWLLANEAHTVNNVGGLTLMPDAAVCGSDKKAEVKVANPPIQFSTVDTLTTHLFAPQNATFGVIPYVPHVLLLTGLQVPCSPTIPNAGLVFMRFEDRFYKFDPRLRLLENTLTQPTDVRRPPSGVLDENTCAVAAPSFLNRGTCVKRVGMCTPLSLTAAPITLTTQTVRQWHSLSGRYVYVMRGLRPDVSPCAGNRQSRWLKLSGTCVTVAGSAISDATRDSFAAALAASTDKNPHVRDIVLPTAATCDDTGAAMLGVRVEVAGTCWEHVHEAHLDVRDLSYWADHHDGNKQAFQNKRPNPITRFALLGSADFYFPSHHAMSRWASKKDLIPKLGRLDDVVSFTSLPTSVQTREMAQLAGALRGGDSEISGFAEVCGSPGEIANIPRFGNRYFFPVPNHNTLTYTSAAEMDTPQEKYRGKEALWSAVSFIAPDQLRQRVAFALLQLLVVSQEGLGKGDETEVWLTYYDILLRHAFGNFGDLLRSVAYSPIMGFYLTYRRNKAFAAGGNFPDENFAREIMQLFSIGLWVLNEDGTPQRDHATGKKIPTYDNDDITTFARVWTGFDNQASRANVDNTDGGGSYNNVDPMQIKPSWRDRFPKTKLRGVGYLGDGFPECGAQGPHAFLQRGARYKLRGTRSAEGAEFDDQAYAYGIGRLSLNAKRSALYEHLCATGVAAGSNCTFPLLVTLNSTIVCDGLECEAESVRSVHVHDARANVTMWYEHLPEPCVRLTFFHGRFTKVAAATDAKKKIDNAQTQCAKPELAIAAPACCHVSTGVPLAAGNGSTSSCRFAAERVTFETAASRCASQGGVVCSTHTLQTNDLIWKSGCGEGMYSWLNQSCTPQVQVQTDGSVALVDDRAMVDVAVPEGLRLTTKEKVVARHLGGSNPRPRWRIKLQPTLDERDGSVASQVMGDLVLKGDNGASWPIYQVQDLARNGDILFFYPSKDFASYDAAGGDATLLQQINDLFPIGTTLSLQALSTTADELLVGNLNTFRVLWGEKPSGAEASAQRYPQAAAGVDCGAAGCSARSDGTCLCDIVVKEQPGFTGVLGVPSRADIEAKLFVGAPDPASLSTAGYVRCTSSACAAAAAVAGGVVVHMRATTVGGAGVLHLDAHTIFELQPHDGAARLLSRRFLRNIVSSVHVGDYHFRNPPTFMPLLGERFGQFAAFGADLGAEPAANEVDALLQHLVEHPSTAPFVATRLIQRLTSSNPSPRYVKAVARAFRTGRYGNKLYSGQNGDLGAAVAAILLDREARSPTLDADATHGKLREPVIKVLHMMRAMEYAPHRGRDVTLVYTDDQLGQAAFSAKSVFNFYLPEYQPAGPVANAGLVAPEAEIATAPKIVGYLNGIDGLIDDGLSSCDGGFTSWRSYPGRSCPLTGFTRREKRRARADGELKWVPRSWGGNGTQLEAPVWHTPPGPPLHTVVLKKQETAPVCAPACTPGATSLYRWNVRVESTATVKDGYTAGPSGLEIVGDNGATFPIHKVQHFAWGGKSLYINPVSDNSLYSDAMLTEFADRFPTGTTMTVRTRGVRDWGRGAAKKVIDELDLLLTDGRLSSASKAFIVGEYNRTIMSGAPPGDALRLAQKLVAVSPEFAASGGNPSTGRVRAEGGAKSQSNRPFKAVVVLFLNGGADSYNMLVPHSGCPHRDMYADYVKTRSVVALAHETLLPISANVSEQPCSKFGLHPSLQTLQQLYASGNAAAIANIGALVEPIADRWDYNTAGKKKPIQLFAHNTLQRAAGNLQADSVSAQGVLGRISDALSGPARANPYSSRLVSLNGNEKIVEGPAAPVIVDRKDGVAQYKAFGRLGGKIANLTGPTTPNIFADTYKQNLASSLQTTEELGELMAGTTLATSFGSGKLAQQLEKVAKVLKFRASMGVDRLGFVTSLGGFDTHFDDGIILAELMSEMDTALGSFVTELKQQGIWENVTLVTISDFGRTLTSNGRGTDHAWGGNNFVFGGAVRGGRILGKFPESLVTGGSFPPKGNRTVLDLGRGRLIPTTPWESVWNAIARWMDVRPDQMDTVLPNRRNFPAEQLFSEADMFR